MPLPGSYDPFFNPMPFSMTRGGANPFPPQYRPGPATGAMRDPYPPGFVVSPGPMPTSMTDRPTPGAAGPSPPGFPTTSPGGGQPAANSGINPATGLPWTGAPTWMDPVSAWLRTSGPSVYGGAYTPRAQWQVINGQWVLVGANNANIWPGGQGAPGLSGAYPRGQGGGDDNRQQQGGHQTGEGNTPPAPIEPLGIPGPPSTGNPFANRGWVPGAPWNPATQSTQLHY